MLQSKPEMHSALKGSKFPVLARKVGEHAILLFLVKIILTLFNYHITCYRLRTVKKRGESSAISTGLHQALHSMVISQLPT